MISRRRGRKSLREFAQVRKLKSCADLWVPVIGIAVFDLGLVHQAYPRGFLFPVSVLATSFSPFPWGSHHMPHFRLGSRRGIQ